MSETDIRSVNVLIKPASGVCNLKCRYCFYNSPKLSPNTDEQGFMTLKTAESIIKRVYEFASEQVGFAFQGGEPTLCGLDFFRNFVKMADKLNTRGVLINYSIQTNGLAITKEWAQFLAKNKFLTGLSIDGTARVHNTNRVDKAKVASLKKVMEAKRLFDLHGVEYNTLCVVTAKTAEYPAQVYDFFKKNDIGYIQYIPCLDPLQEQPGQQDYSLTPKAYEHFLKATFDRWYEDIEAGKIVVVRTFDNYIAMLLNYAPESCGMSGKCSCQFVIEADGSVYPCDFYVSKENMIGDVSIDTFEDIINGEVVKRFIDRGDEISEECKSCRWYSICRDGCRRYRHPDTNLNIYCETFQNFFEYAYPRMQKIAKRISSDWDYR